MRERIQALLIGLLPAIFAGVALGVIELAWVGGTRAELFLSIREFLRFGAIVTCVAISLQLLLACASALMGQVLARWSHERYPMAVALTAGLCTAPLSAWLYWSLTQGRRVRALSYRPIAVSLAALFTSLVLMLCLMGLMRAAQASLWVRRVVCGVLLLTAASALGTDILVLHRLYPAFHWALSAIAVLAVAGTVRVWPFSVGLDLDNARPTQLAAALGLIAALAAPFMLRATQRAPNLRYAIEQAAPLTGKLLRWVRPTKRNLMAAASMNAWRTSPDTGPLALGASASEPRISLRGDDILVITIDALRADRLRAYGSHLDRTPQLDKLAAGSVVFGHAYTQTPHTSYAIGSLWTGKYLRPVLSLPAAAHEHTTLPQILRRFSYRTAAFYPPAVFFVDEQRFAGLAQDHFGFEYVKEMYAPAHERVPQLREYLDRVEPDHPLLVWVHLFEPHEPYDPPPEFARGREPEQRYDGEVAAADAAAGELIELFRSRRPHSTVIVTADHGEEFSDHGGHYHGTTLFDEQVRVPLLWSSPGRVAPRRIEAPVQLVDIAPTLLSALNIPRDPRMRGTDLSALLYGSTSSTARAFASIDELRMWTDGEHKLICETNEGACRLYDLANDPGESRDVTAAEPVIAERLAGELSQLVASIPEGEVLAMQSGDAWPKALARARLGDRAARDELLPLLGDPRASVRAEALRAIATLHVTSALPLVTTLAGQDADASVRDEAVVTGLSLGEPSFAPQVKPLLARAFSGLTGALELARRAAFALPPSAAPDAWRVLVQLAADGGASLRDREQALFALGQGRSRAATPLLIPLLADVRLRAAVARCLAQLGGKPAERALFQALASERYPEARSAEVEALVTLRNRRVLPRIVHFLGTETGLPGGLIQWAALKKQGRTPGGVLFDLRTGAGGQPLRGAWTCRNNRNSSAPAGCRPGAGSGAGRAEVNAALRVPAGPGRAVFSIWASGSDEYLRVGDQEFNLHRGRNEIALPLTIERGRVRLPMRASEGCFIELMAIVQRSADVLPPAPEPYEARASTP